MIYATVCSGIEAPSVAWQPLEWQCAFTSEIEPFPCSVLKYHYPKVPNYGDMLQHKSWPATRLDVLCAGTPCQAFSVAGLRKGLADPRGNLTLGFLGVVEQFATAWVVWENVPGVLSIDGGRTFAAFLGGLAQLGYGFAYTILDAQWFGLAQRRKRVFVVAHSGGHWQRAAAVLFDRESLCGNPPPRRQTGQGTAHELAPCIGASGRGFDRTGDSRGQDAVIPIQEIAATLTKNYSTNGGRTAGNNGGIAENHLIASTLRACSSTERGHNARAGDKDENLVVHTLKADGFDASEDGTGRGTPLVPEVAWALQERDSKGSDSDTKDGHLLPVAFNVHSQNSCAMKGLGPSKAALETDTARCLDGAGFTASQGGTLTLGPRMAVRRLTPRECERLQGFPDDYTLVPHRGKPAADGPRYKALGNSMAVPVLRWIGERIELVSGIST